MFQPVESNVNFPKLEEEILRFWREAGIYEKSLQRRRAENADRRARGENERKFVFYEGPPTANGMPHPGHCLTRAIKDLFPRYRTMRGYLCERKAGWDTHGLPVEVEVCKELGIHSKEDIEKFGIEPFIQKCQQSVWRYMQEWRRMTERIGFWVNLDEAYVTYHQSYVESVWWSLKQLFDRGLLYQGYKIVWWWAQGGTSLSAGEVGLGYREVADPSVYVKFPLVADERTKELGLDGASLLVWTTTPWTLPSNQFAAVHPDLEYAVVDFFRETDEKHGRSRSGSLSQSKSTSGSGSQSFSWSSTATGSYRKSLNGSEEQTRVIVAVDLLKPLADKFNLLAFKIVKQISGRELVGRRYVPPFDLNWNAGPIDSIIFPGSANTHESYARLNAEVRSNGLCSWMLTFRVVEGSFITTDTGTGIVHIAPAFGEDDFEVLLKQQHHFGTFVSSPVARPELINAVAPDGKFTDDGPDYCHGRWVKDCDKDIIHDLKNRGLLFHREEYRHEYPFCWRAEEDPLIQYPRRSWFIKTSEFKQQMLDNNEQINWLPEHIKHGRFGNFLETNVDWALSRERFWGTPLPIWQCEKCNKQVAISSYEELMRKPGIAGTEVWEKAKAANPKLADDLKVHKPYIDAVTFRCEQNNCGGTMRRVTEVIDCWYDSGAMPFAQWGYQGEMGDGGWGMGNGKNAGATGSASVEPHLIATRKFHEQFPADFISEALDQTRGWFYSQLAISTLLFSPQAQGLQPLGFTHEYPHPFRNCIVLGLMLGEDGQKMSKSKRNYREPGEIFDKYGADALRWYFFATQPPWTTIRYSERAIRDSIPEFLLRLWHTYSFFVIYANIDGFEPLAEVSGQKQAASGLTSADLATVKSYRPIRERGELDRWILSELNRTAAAVVERMDAYDNYTAAQRIIEFVDALSNWYVRRSRDRFWAEDNHDPDKIDAYWTLYECLLTTAKIIAPFVPFLAETMWQNLAGRGARGEGRENVGDISLAARSSPLPLESVHLCDFPTGDAAAIDEALSAQMNLVREISSLGRAARATLKMPVRQPLSTMITILVDSSKLNWLESHAALLENEVNVKKVQFTTHSEEYILRSYELNFKVAGPKLGPRRPVVQMELAKLNPNDVFRSLSDNGKVTLTLPKSSGAARGQGDQLSGENIPAGQQVELLEEDLQLKLKAKPGWAAAHGKSSVVLLPIENPSQELIIEGVAREIVHAVQTCRKDRDCEYTDRIEVGVVSDSAEIHQAVEKFGDYIRGETLATVLKLGPLDGVEPTEIKIGNPGTPGLQLYVRIVNSKK